LNPALVATLESTLGRPIEHATRVNGGDINDAYRVTFKGAQRVFVKTHARAPAAMFTAEATGLRWLAEAQALSVPDVLAVGALGEANHDATEGGFLVLPWLERGRPVARFDEHLGQRLAQLHRYGRTTFGFDSDNYIGRLVQRNHPWPSFSEFYLHERLVPQVELARRQGRVDAAFLGDFERLCSRLDQLLGPEESPARLHGDLWSGNVLVGPDGEPWLIDPAVYGGQREVDLAMMRLFGGFDERVFESYNEAFPLRPEHELRIELLQLYPLLVHVNLFGGGYVSSVRRVLAKYQ
jgi:fructosamine-3-kinase